MKAQVEQGETWPPAPNVPPPATPPNAKSGVPYLSLAGLLVGVLANVYIVYWVFHVARLYEADAIDDTSATVLPILIAACLAVFIGLPLSIMGKARGSRALAWVAIGLNVFSLPLAYLAQGEIALTFAMLMPSFENLSKESLLLNLDRYKTLCRYAFRQGVGLRAQTPHAPQNTKVLFDSGIRRCSSTSSTSCAR